MDVDKLKVAELRAELSKRGLDTKGTKPILVSRLKEFMANEAAAPEPEPEPEVEEPKEEEPMEEEAAEAAEPEPAAVEETEAEPEPEPVKEEAKEEETKAEEAKPDAEKKDSAQRRGMKRKMNDDEPMVITENEPEVGENVLCLDWYDSDLSMRIDKEGFMIGEPFNREGWGYVWSGARATHGFNAGKIGYEVKLVDNLESKLEGEARLHELRLGWSANDTSMQLGESGQSYSYNGNGKKATGNKFEAYGATFAKDDVVGAFVDLTSDPVTFHFTKNGEDQGVAFSVPKSELASKALFPHVSSRNVKFDCNFGQAKDGSKRENWFAPMSGYQMAAEVTNRVSNTPRIAKRDDCEMIMLIGLPGCGKTTWVTKYVEEHSDKKFDVIGTASLIEKMKVDGEPKKKHLEGKWDQLIQKSTRCLQDWLRNASARRRNIIIDQTNVYPNAQKRKVRPFEGMTKKAVVIVPTDEDYKARIEAQEKDETRDVPDNAVMEMKANFGLPAEGEDSPFKEVLFVELQREEATKLIEEYNKDAKEKGYGKPQQTNRRRMGRIRGNMRGRGHMRGFPPMRGMMMRGRGHPMRFPRGGPMRGMPMRGGMMPRGGPHMGPMGPMGPPMRGMMMGRGGPMRGNMRGRGGNQPPQHKPPQQPKPQHQPPPQQHHQQSQPQAPRGQMRGQMHQRGGQRGGNMQRGGGMNFRGGRGGNNGNGPQPPKFAKFGGHQQQQQSQQWGNQGGWYSQNNQGQGQWGGGNGGQQWNQNQGMNPMGMNQGMQNRNYGGYGDHQMGGGMQHHQGMQQNMQPQGGWNGPNQMQRQQQGGWGQNQGGYPGSQNWGGFGR